MHYRVLISIILSLILIVATGSAASAAMTEEQCPASDMSAKFPPIRNQGSAGQCYAFTAADLLGYQQGITPPQAVSAIDVGVNFLATSTKEMQSELKNTSDFQTFRNISLGEIPGIEQDRKKNKNFFAAYQVQVGGGFTGLAALAYQKNSGGICLEEKQASEGSLVDTQRDNYIAQRMNQATGLGSGGGMGVYGFGMSNYKPGQKQIPVWASELRPFECKPLIKNLEFVYPAIEEMNKNAMDNIRNDFNKKCETRTPIKPFKVATQNLHRAEGAVSGLFAAQILKMGIPIGISYDPTFLMLGSEASQQPTSHASSLVGARWNKETQTCEFKLRNSWGRGCERYAPEYKKSCQDGYLWITAKDVNTRVSTMTVIAPEDN